MTDGVVFVKLMSGEDVVAKVDVETKDLVTLLEPLTLETGVDETDPSRRYVYMTRFSPYAAGNSIKVRQAAIVSMVDASPLLARYYEASLRYCQKFTDQDFFEGIASTTDTLNQQVMGSSEESETEKGDVTRSRELWAALLSPASSNTSH